MKVQEALHRQGLVSAGTPVDSNRRFPDAAEFRIEIPSVEGPRVLAAVLEQADRYDLTVNRVSQGSGGMLLEEGELREMAALGAEAGLEVCLFTGPKAGYDIGAFSRSEDGRSQFAQIRGMRQLRYAAADIARATEAGIRSFLVGDLGLLAVLTRMQRDGDLPSETVWKISAYMGVSNPASIRLLEGMGAGSVNIPADVTLEQLWEIRSAASIPIDLYLETPDSMGPVVRGHEIADFVAVGAPLHAKMGLANAGGVYPSGGQTVAIAIANAREKVRRAAIALEWLQRERPASGPVEASRCGTWYPGCLLGSVPSCHEQSGVPFYDLYRITRSRCSILHGCGFLVSCVGGSSKIAVTTRPYRQPGSRPRKSPGGSPPAGPPPAAASSAPKRVPPYPSRGPGRQHEPDPVRRYRMRTVGALQLPTSMQQACDRTYPSHDRTRLQNTPEPENQDTR